MSTYVEPEDLESVLTAEQLKDYFPKFRKARSAYQVGIEWELLGVHSETGQALPYYGEKGVESVLAVLADRFGYRRIEERGHVIALERGGSYVALEPGGQLELSAGPVRTIHDIRSQLENFRRELKNVSEGFGAAWLGVGFQPFSGREQLDWVPKRRYEIMKHYLGSRGPLAHDMMKRTAASQVSFDFQDERDAMRKLRAVYGAGSLVSALFAHSPISDGKPNGFLTYRMKVWRETDPARTGLIRKFFEANAGFDDYLNYALDLPMMFIVRGDQWIAMPPISFREFLSNGWENFPATRNDFDLHLSTVFPEARLKNRIEIRGADEQRFGQGPAVAAFWKGILYDEESCEAVWKLTENFSWEERESFHVQMEALGPDAFLGTYRGWDLVRELYRISCAGLKRQGERNASGEDETIYLGSIWEDFITPEKTPAQWLLEKWEKEFRYEAVPLVNFLRI
ncbi:MAG TPA: glutamate-cysteine ligase family protein [Candidatus Omnitrophota bacterium]|nr:glutamate-cysteine ligase family protein [Candidatus Omnitrophota bacterium]